MATMVEVLVERAAGGTAAQDVERERRLAGEAARARGAIAEVVGEVWGELAGSCDEGHWEVDGGTGRLRVFWYWVRAPQLAPFVVACWPGLAVGHVGFRGVYLLTTDPARDEFLGLPVRGVNDVAGFLWKQRQEWNRGKAE